MVSSQPVYRRLWLPFTIGAVLVVVALAIGLWALLRGNDQTAAAGPGERVKVPHTSIPQAKWKINIYPAGALSKPADSVRKTVAREKPRLARVVTDVYDALFLVPERYQQVVTGYFDKPGAGILLHTHLAPPHGSTDVSTKVRRASIGLQADTGARAAARVRVRAQAKDNGHRIAWSTVSTLWMEKESGRWQVIGFDVNQAPVARPSKQGHKKHKGKNS